MPIAIILLASLFLGGGGATVASQKSLPGDNLFPMKLWTEDVRLALAGGDGEAQLRVGFAEKRTREISEVVESLSTKQSDDSEVQRRSRGLDSAVASLEDNLKNAAERVGELRKRGDNEKALELSERVNNVGGVLQIALDKNKSLSRGEIRDRLEAAALVTAELRGRVADQIREIEDDEIRNLSNSDSVSGKIGAAENRLSEIERRIAGREDRIGQDAAEISRERLNEARDIIELAKGDLSRGDFRNSVVRANNAIGIAASIDAILRSRDDRLLRDLLGDMNNVFADIRREGRIDNSGPGSANSGPGSVNSNREQEGERSRGQEFELRGRDAEGEAPRGADNPTPTLSSTPGATPSATPGVDVSGREIELRGRDAEGEAPRGADNPTPTLSPTPGATPSATPGVDVSGRAAEGEAPRGADSPGDVSGGGGSSGSGSSGSGSSGGGSSGGGGGSSDD